MPRLTHIILAIGLLMIPARSFAMDVFPFNISIGGGPGMFTSTSYSIYHSVLL